MMKKIDQPIKLFDLSLFSSSEHQLLGKLASFLRNSRRGGWPLVVMTPNPEQIMESDSNSRFKSILQSANFLIPDGVGLVWASRSLKRFNHGQFLQKRIAGVEVVKQLLKLSAENEYKILIVGGRNYQPLLRRLPVAANQVGWTEAYRSAAEPTASEEEQLTLLIKSFQPDLVFVALGAPYQEYWIDDHRQFLAHAQVKLAMTVGGSFDYLLGKVERAPKWLQALGLEWLFRLIVQPWRWQRQLQLIRFSGKVALATLGFLPRD